MQKITLLGNLGKDPEERCINSGTKLVTFSIAVSPRKDQTVWYECNIWDKRMPMFEGILKHLKKGSRVLIIGDFHTPETYQDSSGNTRIKLKVDPFLINFAGSNLEDKPKETSPSSYESKDLGF